MSVYPEITSELFPHKYDGCVISGFKINSKTLPEYLRNYISIRLPPLLEYKRINLEEVSMETFLQIEYITHLRKYGFHKITIGKLFSYMHYLREVAGDIWANSIIDSIIYYKLFEYIDSELTIVENYNKLFPRRSLAFKNELEKYVFGNKDSLNDLVKQIEEIFTAIIDRKMKILEEKINKKIDPLIKFKNE
jgi:hypothetical protein